MENNNIAIIGGIKVPSLKGINESLKKMAQFSFKNSERDNEELKKVNANLKRMSKEIKAAMVSRERAKEIADVVKGRETFTTVGDRLANKASGVKQLFTARGMANTMGVGVRGSGTFMDTFFSKREAMAQYVRDVKRIDPTASKSLIKEQFKQQQAIQRSMNKVQEEIEGFQARGFREDQIEKTGLLNKRRELAAQLEKVDSRLRPSRKDGVGPTSNKAPKTKKTPIETKAPTPTSNTPLTEMEKGELMVGALEGIQQELAAMSAEERAAFNSMDPGMLEEIFKSALGELSEISREQLDELIKLQQPEVRPDGLKPATVGKEAENEAARVEQKKVDVANSQLDELKKINENLTQKTKGKEGQGSGIGDMIGSLVGGLGKNLMKVIKFAFNPRFLLKAFTKFFLPATIIASLFSGIVDGWKEWKATGSISKAVIAGIGGIFDFLTFGLIDKETVQRVVDFVSGAVNEYIIEPVKMFAQGVVDGFDMFIAKPIQKTIETVTGFFRNVADTFMGFLRNFEIPGFSVGIPGTNIKKDFGPWRPFAGVGSEVKAAAKPTASADAVKNKTNQVTNAKGEVESQRASAASKPVVVSAPTQTNVNNSTTNVMAIPTRNTDSSYSHYLRSRYA